MYPEARLHTLTRTGQKKATPIQPGRSHPAEVHHIEHRVDLEAFADGFRCGGLPSVYVRASGYILLVTIAVVVCYSATLL
jgi:hypothetical protein